MNRSIPTLVAITSLAAFTAPGAGAGYRPGNKKATPAGGRRKVKRRQQALSRRRNRS